MLNRQSKTPPKSGPRSTRYASRLMGQLVAVSGYRPLTILIYHRVLNEYDPLRPHEPTVVDFERDMQLLSTCFRPLPLLEAQQALQSGKLPKRAVCVTFDDGYADNEKLALPLLEKYSVPATVFVSSGYLDGGRMWNDTVIEGIRLTAGKEVDLGCFELGGVNLHSTGDQVTAIEQIIRKIRHWEPQKRQASVDEFQEGISGLPDDLMLTDAQFQSLHSRGIEIGGHTRTHPILSSTSPREAMSEIVGGKQDLEARLNQQIMSFAYPNGTPGVDFDDSHVDMVRNAGFSCAVTTQMGACKASSDPYRLNRFTPWKKTALGFTSQIWANSLGYYDGK